MDKYYEDQANSKENRGFIHAVFDAKEKYNSHEWVDFKCRKCGVLANSKGMDYIKCSGNDFQKIPKEEFFNEKQEAIKEVKKYLKTRIEEYKLEVEKSNLPTNTAYYNGKVCSAEDVLFFLRGIK